MIYTLCAYDLQGIIVGLKDGEYPVEEGKWLATTAWNRAALPVKLGQIDVAKKWII